MRQNDIYPFIQAARNAIFKVFREEDIAYEPLVSVFIKCYNLPEVVALVGQNDNSSIHWMIRNAIRDGFQQWMDTRAREREHD